MDPSIAQPTMMNPGQPQMMNPSDMSTGQQPNNMDQNSMSGPPMMNHQQPQQVIYNVFN